MTTKEQAHTATPGPWIAAAAPANIVGWPIVAQTGRLICNLATPPKDIDRIGKFKDEYDAFMAECGANARLIAAAPELLAALKDFVSETRAYSSPECEECEIFGPLLRAADAAIAKAEGRS